MDMFYMGGTERTGEYSVRVITPRGRLGVRELSNGSARIRVEPIGDQDFDDGVKAYLTSEGGWKQPGDDEQNRFSRTVSQEEVEKMVLLGIIALI